MVDLYFPAISTFEAMPDELPAVGALVSPESAIRPCDAALVVLKCASCLG